MMDSAARSDAAPGAGGKEDRPAEGGEGGSDETGARSSHQVKGDGADRRDRALEGCAGGGWRIHTTVRLARRTRRRAGASRGKGGDIPAPNVLPVLFLASRPRNRAPLTGMASRSPVVDGGWAAAAAAEQTTEAAPEEAGLLTTGLAALSGASRAEAAPKAPRAGRLAAGAHETATPWRDAVAGPHGLQVHWTAWLASCIIGSQIEAAREARSRSGPRDPRARGNRPRRSHVRVPGSLASAQLEPLRLQLSRGNSASAGAGTACGTAAAQEASAAAGMAAPGKFSVRRRLC